MQIRKKIILFHLFLLCGLPLLLAQTPFKKLEIEDGKIKVAYSFNDLTVPSARTASAAASAQSATLLAASCFVVGTNPCVVLPVKLLDLTATRTSDLVASIKWETAEESNLKGYFVERSTNPATAFIDRGFVAAKNNGSFKTSYQFSDPNDLTLVSYYRLRMLDVDGSFTYSEIKPVGPVKESSALVLFPNPATDILNMRIKVVEKQNSTIVLYDATGREIRNWKKNLSRGTNVFSENISSLSAGSYYIVIRSNTAVKISCSFFKN